MTLPINTNSEREISVFMRGCGSKQKAYDILHIKNNIPLAINIFRDFIFIFSP
jgi:hypothetical protein